MHFTRGRPRFWIPGFDTAHLAVPGLLLLVLCLIAAAPATPVPVRPAPAAPQPLNPASILSPTSGSVLSPEQLSLIEGVAHPGSSVQLYWHNRPVGPPAQAGIDGRWHFINVRFPPGQHVLSVVARSGNRQTVSASVLVTVKPPPAQPKPTRRATRSR